MDNEKGRVDEAGKRDRAIDRLRFRRRRMADCVVAWCAVPRPQQPIGHPSDDTAVLGVNHRERAVRFRDAEDVEELAVIDLHEIVGHEDLEGGDAPRKSRRQFLGEHLLRRIRDDQVIPVIDDRCPVRAAIVEVERLRHPHATMLRGEGHETRIPPECCGDGAASIIVRGHAACGTFLRDMRMGLDPAREDQPTGRVDHVGRVEPLPDRGDPSQFDPYICRERIGGGGDLAASNDEVETHHDVASLASPQFPAASERSIP
ncbi:hypothetical protein [Palleronia aestuarii]|uniref:hypothetical protein n=1 Tax=Palleronia aestuarii TaxID=568105 RepID=UPI003570F07A